MSRRPAHGGARARAVAELTVATARGARSVRPGRFPRAVRITVVTIGPLLAGQLAGEITWGLAATWGAFAGFYGHDRPYRERARLVAVMALVFLLAALAGRLAATSGVALVLVGGGWAALATLFARSLALEPPREYMLILIMLLVASLPVQPVGLAVMVPCALAGGAWAWLVLMAGWLVDREAPERRAVAAALLALAPLTRPGAKNAQRHQAVLALRGARRAVAVAGGPGVGRLQQVLLATEDLADQALALPEGEGPPAAWAERLTELEAALLAPPAPAAPAPPRPWRRLLLGWPRPAELFSRASLVPPTAARVGVAVTLSLALGVALEAQRAYWIAVTAAAILQGTTMLVSTRRAIERTIGTAAGVLLGFAIVEVEPSALGIIAAAAAFTFVAETTILASYAFGVAFITPLVLLLGEVAAPGILTDGLVAWRLLDTVIGCVVGVLAGRLLWPGAARVRLDRAIGDLTAAVGELLELAPGDPRRRPRRDAVRRELIDVRAVADAALGERLTSSPQADASWPLVAAAEQLAYRALAGAAPAEQLQHQRARISEGLARLGSHPPDPGPTG